MPSLPGCCSVQHTFRSAAYLFRHNSKIVHGVNVGSLHATKQHHLCAAILPMFKLEAPNADLFTVHFTAHAHTLAVLLQEAVDILIGASVPMQSRRVFEAWPHSGLSLCRPVLLRRKTAPYTVHEMPHIMWRRTLSFDDESDARRASWSDLADAALVLLDNSALDEAAKAPHQQQHGDCQTVPSGQCKKCSPSVGGNWEAFVQKCLMSNTTAVTHTELLGCGQQMDWQGGQQGGQQVSELVGHGQQQAADASSVDDWPLQCQVRLNSGPE